MLVWNTLVQDVDFLHIGPRRLDWNGVHHGTIPSTFGRTYVSFPLFGDEFTVEMQEQDGKGKVGATVCTYEGDGSYSKEGEKWFNDTKDRKNKPDEYRKVTVSDALSKIVVVHLDGKSALRSFGYYLSTDTTLNLPPEPTPTSDANLVVDDSLTFYEINTDDDLMIFARVQNVGGKPSGPSLLGFYLSDDKRITTDDHYIGTQAIPSLSYKQSSDHVYTVDHCNDAEGVPPYAKPGTYYVGVIADFLDQAPESNERDNEQEVKWLTDHSPVEICSDFEPDLTIGNAHRDYNRADDEIVFTTVARNVGNGNSGRFKVGYYLSRDDNINVLDTLIGEQSMKGLAPGEETAERTFTASVCGHGLRDGTFYVGWVADYAREVDESDETNNSQGGRRSIEIDCS